MCKKAKNIYQRWWRLVSNSCFWYWRQYRCCIKSSSANLTNVSISMAKKETFKNVSASALLSKGLLSWEEHWRWKIISAGTASMDSREFLSICGGSTRGRFAGGAFTDSSPRWEDVKEDEDIANEMKSRTFINQTNNGSVGCCWHWRPTRILCCQQCQAAKAESFCHCLWVITF